MMESADDNNMELLQPDENNHSGASDPVLECYHATFKLHLQDLLKETNLEILEKKNLLKVKREERKNLGVKLYDEQERLVSQQEKLRNLNTRYEEILFLCQEEQKQLIDERKNYEKCTVNLKVEEKTEIELTHQLEQLNHELAQLAKLDKDTSSHCAIMKTIKQKSDKEKDRLSVEHYEQDLRIYGYMKTLNKLREDINHNKRILEIQNEEANELREQIAEAEVEMKAIHLDFKQLLAHWKNSLLALSKRDEAVASIKLVLSKRQTDLQALKTEGKRYKNIIQDELERNEQLTLICNQKKAIISHLTKMKDNFENNAEATYQVCSILETAVKQSENNYHQLIQELNSREEELQKIEESIRKKKLENNDFENKKIDIMHEKSRNDSNCKSIHQSIKRTQEKIKEMEKTSQEEETKLKNQLLKMVEMKMSCEMLKEQLSNLKKMAEEINKECNVLEKKIKEIDVSKNNKNRKLYELNKILMQFPSNKDSPDTAIKNDITFMTHNIKDIDLECSNAEGKWLEQQCELMHLSKQFAIVIKEIMDQKFQLAIHDEKRLRIEDDINCENKEVINLEHEVQNLQNDIIRLNTLLHKEENLHGNLKEQSVLIEYDFMEKLKKEELEYVQSENALNTLRNKSEMLINQIIKTERESLAWRRKIQQAEETRKRLTFHLYSDIKSHETEIHRLQLQKNGLKREKEMLQHDLENAVHQHAALYAKTEIKNTLQSLKKDNIDSIQRQENNIRRKINHIQKSIEECEQELGELQELKLKAEYNIEKYKTQKTSLEYEIHHKNEEIQGVYREKYQNLTKLALKQQKLKYYEDIKNHRYRISIKSYGMHEIEIRKLKRQLQLMKKISEETSKQYPTVAANFDKVISCIECSNIL